MHPRMKPSYLLPIIACISGPVGNAQNFFWDFEGPNGLNGWHNYDGTPVQTTTGAASTTSLWVETGPPEGEFGSSPFIYHLLPYDPNVFYHVTIWEKTATPDVLIRALITRIDTLAVPATLDAVSAAMVMGTSTWHFMEYLDTSPVDGSGAYCLCITASAPGPGTIAIDNVSVEMVPQTSVMMRSPMLLLGGALNGSQMNTHLRDQSLLPLTEPYTALGYPQVGGGGGEWCTPMIVDANAWHRAVDWVRMELRAAADPAVVVATRQLMLTHLGITCGYNGQWMLSFNVPPGNYYVAVHHRNHLGAMSATPISLAHNFPTVAPDFRSGSFATWGTDARMTSGSYRALWPGDVNGNGQIKYTGAGNDRDPILQFIGGSNPTTTATGYANADVNLDGVIKYVGSGNDRDPILVTVGSTTPNAVRIEQVP